MEQRPLSDGKFEMVPQPGIMCVAFCIELALKSLILANGIQYSKEHDLSSLFDKLPKETQQAIVVASRYPDAAFPVFLKGISNAFIDWRYVFEAEYLHIDHAFLIAMAKGTLAVAQQTFPDV
jgi:HEPN domain-containing protein